MDFAPHPEQVTAFFKGLADLGSEPLEPAFRVGKLSGKFRTGSHPLTGEKLSIPIREFATVDSPTEMPKQLAGLDDYDVVASGQGPPELLPFVLYTATDLKKSEFKGTYGYEVLCRLRKDVISMCEPSFGDPCPAEEGNGKFRHPTNGTTIEVPNAASARFWIEFQFGKWLFPEIGTSLNVIDPLILTSAIDSFGTTFAQGCRFE
ncbi:MAG: hypothetical protein LAO30_14740 [Acidobacteriia bacterium]|nr:hypothetical protein [Terriglobia bacterium]